MTTGTNTNGTTLKTGWINLSNNIDPTGSVEEWTIARYGNFRGSYYVYIVDLDGINTTVNEAFDYAVQPVFYLNSDIALKSGTGTITDSYIIQ